MRFAFWGAEEAGLVGSTAYVAEQVANGGVDQIEANLNFDMVGSPNFVRFVYDGDLSDSEPPAGGAPQGSARSRTCSSSYFDKQGLANEPTAFDGRSDYGPFIAERGARRRPVHGRGGHQDARAGALYGGVAGLAYDPCYHQACDTLFNLNHTALDEMSDAAAHAAWTLARSQSPITVAQAAKGQAKVKTASRARKAKANRHTKSLRYRGQFRIR